MAVIQSFVERTVQHDEQIFWNTSETEKRNKEI
jgi:hypothetical protein